MKLSIKLCLAAMALGAGSVNAQTVLIDWSTSGTLAAPDANNNYWNSLGEALHAADVAATVLKDSSTNTDTAWSVAADLVGNTSNNTGAGFGGTGINGPSGGNPFNTGATLDGMYANYNANGYATITFTGLAPNTQYDLSLIGGRASNGSNGIIKVITGTTDGNAVDNDLIDADDLLDSYTLLNSGAILNFSVTSNGSGIIAFKFFEGQNDTNGTSNATLNAMSLTASGTPPGPSGELKVTSITKSGGTVTVGFEGVDGQTYDLNKSTDLDFSVVDSKDTVTLTGTTTGTLQDPTASEDAAFYRVEQQ